MHGSKVISFTDPDCNQSFTDAPVAAVPKAVGLSNSFKPPLLIPSGLTYVDITSLYPYVSSICLQHLSIGHPKIIFRDFRDAQNYLFN